MIIGFDHIAFHAANVCRGSLDPRFHFIVCTPTGAVQGTDGFQASYHASGCTPFELPEADKVLTVRPTSAVPVTATELTLDVAEDYRTGVLQYTQGRKTKFTHCDIALIDPATYPDIQKVVPSHASAYNSDLLHLDFGRARGIARALSGGADYVVLQFTQPYGVILFETKNHDHVVLLAPRSVPEDVMRPLPLQEETDE